MSIGITLLSDGDSVNVESLGLPTGQYRVTIAAGRHHAYFDLPRDQLMQLQRDLSRLLGRPHDKSNYQACLDDLAVALEERDKLVPNSTRPTCGTRR